MVIIKNALSNIMCSKGRNALIGIIVLVIAISSCIALSVKNAAQQAEEDGLANLSVTASIDFDREKLMQSAQSGDGSNFREQMQNISSLSIDEMLTYSESEYVDEFRYSMSSSINGSDEFEPVSTDTSTDTTTENMPSDMPSGGMGGGKDMTNFSFAQGDFTIVGYNSYTSMTDFVSGSSQISDGEIFDIDATDYECVISTELAAYNELSVGDTFTLTNPNDDTQTFEFTITGLYTYTSSESSGFNMQFSTAMDSANQIYTSYSILNEIVTYTTDNATVTTDDNNREQSTALTGTTTGTYVLSDVESYEAFAEDVYTLGLSDSYTVSSTDISSYESSLIPIQNTAKFATMMLYIILAIGGVILIVLNMFNIRERKYEVGVLTAIGMQKYKVAAQFVAELLIVTIAAIIIGTAIGAVASVPVSNSLLEAQITAQETQSTQQLGNFGNPSGGMPSMGGGNSMPSMGSGMFGNFSSSAEYISTLNATTNFSVVLQLIGIGVLLTIVTSLVSVVFVMRYEPLKILSERT